MKFKLFSVVVGTEACVASCPFCVSGVAPNPENMCCSDINWKNFAVGCNLANRNGVDTVMLTSRGEPLLFPEQITEYLKHLRPYNFPFVELQTNIIPVGKNFSKYEGYLYKWFELGLTTICISVVSHDFEKNRNNYTPAESYISLPDVITKLHKIGYSIRLTCVLCKDITHELNDVKDFIKYAERNKVEQVTLRPVNDEYRRESARQWIEKHRLSQEQKDSIQDFLQKNGTLLLNLERLGCVYDVDGQNVMFSEPLNKNIRNTDPDNGRQLIFFQDGHLRYEWEKEGGILL